MDRRAAESLDSGLETATMDAAMAKRFATDACFSVADDAVQVTTHPMRLVLLHSPFSPYVLAASQLYGPMCWTTMTSLMQPLEISK